MNGWIVYNGHLPSKKFIDFANWMKDAGLKKGLQMQTVKNNSLLVELNSTGSKLISINNNTTPDFVIFSDKDIPLARQLEQMNIPIFNSANAIETCDNKISTYQQLAKHGIPIPKTIISPKVFANASQLDLDSFIAIEEQFSYPLIIKEAFGSFGEQVYLINSRTEFIDKVSELKGTPFVVQQFISSSYGKDVRINVIGGKVVASMLRVGNDDFRANVNAGGLTEPYTPSIQEQKIAIAAAKSVGVDFAGVDLLFGEDNQPIVCEVNSNAHIRGIFDCTGINVADYMMDFIIDKLGKN